MLDPRATGLACMQGLPSMHADVERGAHQSWPTTNSAQNMVPCATQYSGHTNLRNEPHSVSCNGTGCVVALHPHGCRQAPHAQRACMPAPCMGRC